MAIAKFKLLPDAVRINISGSMMGEAIQKAITGARGTPDANMAAISGITPHEQKGERAPAREAAIIVTQDLPENTRAIWASNPVAFATPANATARKKNGAIPIMDCSVKRRL